MQENAKKNNVNIILPDNALGSMPLSEDLLEKSITGFWVFEFDDGADRRLYVDDKSKQLLGLDLNITPEDTYKFWHNTLDKTTLDLIRETLNKMIAGNHVETEYIMHNVCDKNIAVRCEGLRNSKYTKGIRLEGLYQNITNISHINDEVTVQKTNLIENAAKAYDFVYKVNLNDASFLVLKIQDFMIDEPKDFKDFDELKDHMINGFIHPADREMMKNELDYKVIREKIKSNPVYRVEYRAFVNNTSYWNEMTVTTIDENNVCIGFAENDHGIILRMLQEKMSGNFFALYEVDFDANLVKIIQKEDFYNDIPVGRTVPYNLWIKCVAKYYAGDMKDLLTKLRDPEYVYKTFENENKLTFSYYGRVGEEIKGRWINCTIYAVRRHSDGRPSIFTIGFSFADALEIENKELQTQLNENLQTINGLAEEYSALFYVNMDNAWFRTFSYDENRLGKPSALIVGEEPGPEIIKRFGDSENIHPEDKIVFEGINNEYIRQRLLNTKKFSIRFRMKINADYSWCELDVIKYEGVDERPNSIAIGFAERDVEIRSEQTLNRFMDVVSSKGKPSEAIEKLLGVVGDFYGSDRAVIFEFDEKRKEVFDTFEWCAEGISKKSLDLGEVSNKEIDFWLKTFRSDGAVILDFNAKNSKFTNGGIDSFVKEGITSVGAAPILNGSTIVGCIGIDNPRKALTNLNILKNASVLVYSEILRNKQEEEAKQLINRFVHNYKASFIVNAKNDTYRPIISYQGTFSSFVSGDSYIKGIQKYADQVYEDDRALLKETFQIKNIYKRFQKDSEFTVRYRCLVHGFTTWLECRFSKLTDDEFIFAIADVDRSVALELAEEAVSGDFFALFLADIKFDTLKVVKAQQAFAAGTGINTMKLSDALYMYASSVSKKYRDEWQPVLTLDGLKEFLGSQDKRELIFESDKETGRLSRCTFYVVSREATGAPHMICISFTELDEEQAEREILHEKIAEQNIQLANQQRQLEVALKDAESANKSKTNFLFNMSHDIRTPMNAIRGFTIMAKKYVDDKEKIVDYLNKIDISGNQLLLLINQVLEMSRIESGKTEIINKSVNIKDTFESIITVLGAQAKVRGIGFTYSFDNVKHLDVLADEARVGQITFNIVGNSLKYTPEGGKVSLTFEEVKPRKDKYATFEFTVIDNGIGMSKEFLDKLFDPFTREKNSTVSHIQGTGLGMTICKSLVDIMGGDIKVTSKPGKGTKFVVTLDFAIDDTIESEADETTEIKAVSFEGKRVLLVEDNEMNREIASDILSDAGIIIEEAEDGDIAVNKIQDIIDKKDYYYYDAILMDIQMPKMNGYDATKAIRKMLEKSNPNLPIIAMTANAFEEDRKNAKNAGMNDHIAKPIDVQRLFETLSKHLYKNPE